MRSDLRTGLAALLASLVLATTAVLIAALGLAGGASAEGPAAGESSTTATESPTETASPTETPTETASPTATPSEAAFDVDDAQLRWGVNDESNGKAPVGFNFFSAGRLANRGANHSVTSADWRQKDGTVGIEKLTAAGTYAQATWAGLTTDAGGTTLTSGRVSGHQIVWNGGAGTVDPDSGDATIRWKGSATVVYYSGLSFFYVTDPVLTVTDGTGVLTATLSGYGSSQTDTSSWVSLPATPVTLANLGTVDVGADGGFTATPAYRGVSVSLASGMTAQVRTGEDWGSFPQSFVDFQARTGLSSYWYSSGGAADAHKVAQAMTVSFEASRPVTVPTRVPTADPVDQVTNEALQPPTPAATVTATTVVTAAAPVVAAPPTVSAPPTAAATPAAAVPAAHPADTVLALTAAATDDTSAPTWPWAAGGLALLVAALLFLLPAWPSVRQLTQRRSRAAHQGASAP